LQREIANRFGVGQTTISLILRRVTWRHVGDCPGESSPRDCVSE
jgi:transposase